MKKVTAFLTAIMLVLLLFSCSNTASNTSPSSSTTSTPASSSTSTPSASPSSSSSPSANASSSVQIPYLNDNVDYFSREPYHVSFLYAQTTPVSTAMGDLLVTLGKKMNFTVMQFDATGDMDKYVNAIQQEIGTGTNGFIFQPWTDILGRQDDLCKESKVPYICTMTPYTDAENHCLCPTVTFDGVQAGINLADWIADNYSKYIKNVELSAFGFAVLDFSISHDFTDRSDGFINELTKLHPEVKKNIFRVDLADTGYSADSGYNKTAPLLAAHADIKYWVVFGTGEDFNVGACRAIEAANKVNECLVISTGNDICFTEWANGTSPEWVATIPSYSVNLTVPAAAGLVALMDGRATADTLWKDLRAPGDIATRYNTPVPVITKDTYKNYVAESDAVLDTIK